MIETCVYREDLHQISSNGLIRTRKFYNLFEKSSFEERRFGCRGTKIVIPPEIIEI